MAARRKDRLDALVAEIEQAGGKALAIEADITDREQAPRRCGARSRSSDGSTP